MALKTSAVTPIQICSESLNNTEEQISSPGFTGEETQVKIGGVSCARSGVTKGKGRPGGGSGIPTLPVTAALTAGEGPAGGSRARRPGPCPSTPLQRPLWLQEVRARWQNGSCVRAKGPRRLALTDGHRALPLKEQQGPRRAQDGAQGVHSGVTRRERMC